MFPELSPPQATVTIPFSLTGTVKSGEQIRTEELFSEHLKYLACGRYFLHSSGRGSAAPGREERIESRLSSQLDLGGPLTLITCLEGWAQQGDLLANWLKGIH